MEEKVVKNPNVENCERTYTQSEVDGILLQYRAQLEQLKKAAQSEISKRDLGNFYQTLSVLFEIVRYKDAYSTDFVNNVISVIETSVTNLLGEDNKETKKDE